MEFFVRGKYESSCFSCSYSTKAWSTIANPQTQVETLHVKYPRTMYRHSYSTHFAAKSRLLVLWALSVVSSLHLAARCAAVALTAHCSSVMDVQWLSLSLWVSIQYNGRVKVFESSGIFFVNLIFCWALSLPSLFRSFVWKNPIIEFDLSTVPQEAINEKTYQLIFARPSTSNRYIWYIIHRL